MRREGEESNNGHYYTEFYDIQENTVIEVNDTKIIKKDKIPHGKVRQEHAKAVIYQVQLPSNSPGVSSPLRGSIPSSMTP